MHQSLFAAAIVVSLVACSSSTEPNGSVGAALATSAPSASAPAPADSTTTPPPPAPLAGPCDGKKCGDACPSPFGSPVATYCNATGACAPGAAACDPGSDCDLSHVACEHFTPSCKAGETPSVKGVCYGDCVPITSCACDPASKTSCPPGSQCDATTKRCAVQSTD